MPDDPGFAPAIIIGAGPAGLAVGACLKRAGVRSIVLEQAAEVGSSWRGHYDRLHLHTDRRNSALPFIHFPKGSPSYASRDAVVGYLEGYAARVRLDIRFWQQVVGARREAGTWRVTTEEGTFTSSYLVVAAGNARTPHLPSWPGMADFGGTLLHSSAYRNSHELAGDRALVVGFGNSGGEIAIDLSEGGFRTSISVRSPVNVIPREVLGLPILSIGIAQDRLPPSLADALNAPVLAAAVGDITSYGLRKLPYGPATQIRRDGSIPLIDIGTMSLIRSGAITVRPGIESFTTDGVRFDDGTHGLFDTVVLATGYRPHVHDFLDAPAAHDGDGNPRTSGHEAGVPGLYFCGYYVSPTGMLREIGLEARRIAASIATTAPSLPAS